MLSTSSSRVQLFHVRQNEPAITGDVWQVGRKQSPAEAFQGMFSFGRKFELPMLVVLFVPLFFRVSLA